MSQDKHQSSRLIFNPRGKAVPTPGADASEEARLQAAREKAAEYRNPDAHTASQDNKVREMDEWGDIVSQRIEEAIRRGDFDNLSGHGKPMQVEREPFVPEDQQMAFKLLKNNDLVPDWIAERREILRVVEHWRSEFQRIVEEAQTAWAAAQSEQRRHQLEERWARWITRWENEVVEINRRINTLNLKQPVTHLEVFKLRLDAELRALGMGRKLEK
jgi:DnaJ homolog subfamily C member 28